LAISAQISNVFSGIIINMERPFKVGDWIKIGSLDEGMVTDVTWRTIRVLTRDGYTISMPNGRASDSEIHNFTSEDNRRITFYVHLSNQHDPDYLRPILDKAIRLADGVLSTPVGRSRYDGVENIFGQWVAKYHIQFFVDDYADKDNISERVWNSIWNGLSAENISLSLVGRRGADELREEVRTEDGRLGDDDTVLDEIIEGIT
jgi:potassium-dependent mechanosensitive channel